MKCKSVNITWIASFLLTSNGAFAGNLTPEEEEYRRGTRLAEINGDMPDAVPCHVLKVNPKFSFPQRIVTHVSNQNECYLGKCTPPEYAALKFLNIEDQSYDPGEKVYFIAAIWEPGADEDPSEEVEHVGWVSYRVGQVDELYDPVRHAKFGPLRTAGNLYWGERTQVSNGEVTPYIYERYYTVWEHTISGDIPVRKNEKRVGYEMCFKASTYGTSLTKDVDFPPAGVPKVWYSENEPPTYLGFIVTENATLQEYINKINTAEAVVLFLRDVTPIIGTACHAMDCIDSKDPVCWAEVGVDAASDIAMLLTAGGSSLTEIGKFGTAGRKIEAAGRGLGYATIGANLGLAAVEAQRGRFLEALGRSVGAGIDVGVLTFQKGIVRYKRLGKTSGACDKCPASLVETPKRPQSCIRTGEFRGSYDLAKANLKYQLQLEPRLGEYSDAWPELFRIDGRLPDDLSLEFGMVSRRERGTIPEHVQMQSSGRGWVSLSYKEGTEIFINSSANVDFAALSGRFPDVALSLDSVLDRKWKLVLEGPNGAGMNATPVKGAVTLEYKIVDTPGIKIAEPFGIPDEFEVTADYVLREKITHFRAWTWAETGNGRVIYAVSDWFPVPAAACLTRKVTQ